MSEPSRAELTPSTAWVGAFAAWEPFCSSLSQVPACPISAGQVLWAQAGLDRRLPAQQQLQEAGDLPWAFPSAALLKGRPRTGTLPSAQVLLGGCCPRNVGQFGDKDQKTQPRWDRSTPEFISLVLLLLQGPWVRLVSVSHCLLSLGVPCLLLRPPLELCWEMKPF